MITPQLVLCFVLFSSIESRPTTDEKLVEYYPLTWKTIENDFSKNFAQQLITGPKRSVKRLGNGDTKGFMSKVFQVNFDWQNVDPAKETPPAESAVKVIATNDINRFFNITGKDVTITPITYAAWAHDQELFLYGNLTKMRLIDELRFPKFYAGKPFDYTTGWGYLSMEFIANVTIKHIYDDFSDDEIMQGLEQLAKMNALSLRHKAEFSKFIQSQLYDIWRKDAFSKNQLKWLDLYAAKHLDKADKIKKLKQVMASFDDQEGMQRKLERNCPIKMWTHGDLWPPNLFWQNDENGRPKLRKVVDFQYTNYGNPLFDMVQWFFFAVKPRNYRIGRDKYLRFYYGKLRELAKGERIPWDTYDEFVKQYEIMIVWKAVDLAHMLETVKEQMLLELPEAQRRKSEKLFENRYSMILDEASRIFDRRKADVL